MMHRTTYQAPPALRSFRVRHALRSIVRAIVATLAALLAGLIIALPIVVHVLELDPLPPCATEDSSDCIWDAPNRGNGEGRSFVDVGGRLFIEVP